MKSVATLIPILASFLRHRLAAAPVESQRRIGNYCVPYFNVKLKHSSLV